MVRFLADSPANDHQGNGDFERLSDVATTGLPKVLGKDYPRFRDYLTETFAGKCCYCESLLGAATDGEIELFRPRIVDDPGPSARKELYWYLAQDWRNLYLACPSCNRNKANRFPVEGGVRAEEGLPYAEVVEIERPLLLDPCDVHEDPDRHLVFLRDGTVAGRTERGRATVEILALNRRALVKTRANESLQFQNASSNERSRRAEGVGPYAAVWRQMLFAERHPESSHERFEASSEQKASDARLADVSTEDAAGLENYRAVARYIERIRIENFGPIGLLELDLSCSMSSLAPCFALLGENGVGKSTVLRAVAMALSGKAYTRRLGLSSNALLPANAYKGEVRVSIVGQPDLVMTLRRNRPIDFNKQTSSSLVLAYGATRLLPRGRHKPKSGERHAKIDNLFDPFLPLADPEQWLAGLELQRLSDVNGVLQRLLPTEQRLELVRDDVGQGLRVLIASDPERRIRELSDGFQSMLGMAVDIMQVMFLAYESMESAQGVVLIDELGNHFHPAWRLRCVNALRAAFPRVQFIFTTHDPLCLRGLVEGEVAVLRRNRLRQIYALEDLPPVHKLRVEQLLSSEHFGLSSTLDPLLEECIKEYEKLIENGDRTEAEERRLDEIIGELTEAQYLGSSRRERMALQLLDNERDLDIPSQTTVNIAELSKATVTKLKRLMGEIEPTQRPLDDQN
jgi:hypothetical protein